MRFAAQAIIVLCSGAALAGCGADSEQHAKTQKPAVSTARPVERQPVPSEVALEIQRLWLRFATAIRAGHPGIACRDMMTDQARRQLERIGRGRTCAQIIASLRDELPFPRVGAKTLVVSESRGNWARYEVHAGSYEEAGMATRGAHGWLLTVDDGR